MMAKYASRERFSYTLMKSAPLSTSLFTTARASCAVRTTAELEPKGGSPSMLGPLARKRGPCRSPVASRRLTEFVNSRLTSPVPSFMFRTPVTPQARNSGKCQSMAATELTAMSRATLATE